MDQSSLNNLLQSTTKPNPSSLLGSSLSNLIEFATIASLVLTLVFIVFWITAALHRRKVQNAIIDIQKTLHEMNERDKLRQTPTPQPVIQTEPPVTPTKTPEQT